MEIVKFLATDLEQGRRLDHYLAENIADLSRSRIQSLIAEGQVKVNEQIVKANYKLRVGDHITLKIPDPQILKVVPENIPLDILYEDDDVVVVNKSQGMVVHPAPGNYSGTLVNALLYHCKNLSGINGILRPGIVHRIDKDTSGVLVVAKNDSAHQNLAVQIKDHTVRRIYLAIVHGVIKEQTGMIDAPIGRDPADRKKITVISRNSKDAITTYEVLERFADFTFLQLKLKTGRTHQIRVHMSYVKHPVLGDPLYGPQQNKLKVSLKGQALHAAKLGFIHPSTNEYMEFSAPLPVYFADILTRLREEKN
ncbi:RluA family pseudouridine synthase [Bacillota bacterium LX-D]|nr:RluA family pseudouridine synthase [Bacillota bacterium LX-D]